MQLADLGAEVIKIDDPTVGGDVSRYALPYQQGTDSLFFESFNRNKRSGHAGPSPATRHATFSRTSCAVSDALISNLRGDQPGEAGASGSPTSST